MNLPPNNARPFKFRRRFPLALLAAALFCSAHVGTVGSASAQDEPTVDEVRQAGEEFNLGRTAFQDEDYATAAEHFERADSLAPNSKVLLLAIQARDLAGHSSRAATLAALAQDRYPEDESLADTRNLITKALEEQGKLKVTCEPACSLLIDGRLVHGQPSTKRFIFVEDGEHSVRAGWDGGETESREFTVAAGGSARLAFQRPGSQGAVGAGTLEDEDEIDWGDEPAAQSDGLPERNITYDSVETTPAEPTPEQERDGLSPTVFWVGAGLTVGLIGVSTWSGLDTQSNPGRDAVEDACRNDSPDCDRLYQDGKDAERRTNILWGATAGVGLATILIGSIWTDWGGPAVPADMNDFARSKRKRESASVQPWVELNAGATIGARGRF